MSFLCLEILATLIEGPGYGLEIQERLRRRGAERPTGALYPILRDLERDGLLTSFAGESAPARGGRPRIYYELTGKGRQVAFEAQEKETAWGGEPGMVPA